ncbi:hypothetical protein K2P97_10980 [bacterium]|nr:hypothetical protein [bacterium]
MKTVIALIKKQHLLLSRSIALLQNPNVDPLHKQEQMIFFVDMLIACMKAEEKSLLGVLQQSDICQELAFDVIEGHAIAQILIFDLEELDYKNKWDAQVIAKLKTLMRLIQNNSQEKVALLKQAAIVLSKNEQLFLGKKFQKNLN